MIHYRLRCGAAHEFEGWFRDSAGYAEQASDGLLECPSCGCHKIERALMTPAVARKGALVKAEPEVQAPPPDMAVMAPPDAAVLPDGVRALLQRMRAEVEKRCDYVGADFAAEARRIHYGDSDYRPIYGETSVDEAEALTDEGIELNHLPWVPRAEG